MQQHEKTSLRYVFFRLYSNDELLDFLKEQLKNGLVLDHCKGNFFFFRRWQLQNARLCVISIPCSKPRVEDDDEVQEYLDIAKRKGWQLLCVGDYESLLPMRRRLYFYTCDDRAQPLEPGRGCRFSERLQGLSRLAPLECRVGVAGGFGPCGDGSFHAGRWT